MHLVPADRAGRRIIDDHRVCDAIAAVGDSGDVARWAGRFAVLSDPNRLALLLAIHAAAPISVTDLSVATGMNDAAVSQALRLLRTGGLVTGERTGRVIRYRLADPVIHSLLHLVRPPHEAP
ncbi:ArsR/SmtB family transcription factor [Actinoallomurus iriomotensis]|uniref:Transcriptional regulator n=1 Tax=Actinoallomurus iriomotensis TaxID=478107 RepID=A0A9W6VV80_9ACTN|nr:metalloregulator ArsR/SmtB family transcription factor [Actinoallomurus iriomotensis]GLY80302.1 transcriptional regulator [Actinoallomurus iriomotensis]GLY86809.1 transcriptional regulator [Actinoallomurus iriomotensis]